MPESRGKHLTREDREAVEEGIRGGGSARGIARAIGVSASTVAREARANRTAKDRKRAPGTILSSKCAGHKDCRARGTACAECASKLTACRECRARDCIDHCPDFRPVACPQTESWPYVCPERCAKKAYCMYPRYSYSAADADASYRARLSGSRAGVNVTPEELEAMAAVVAPLVRQGQSFEAIWATHGGELPVGVRSAYNYQEAGILGAADVELPRKVRMRKRKGGRKAAQGRDRVDRSGRTYADFQALPLPDLARVVQGDSVCGHGEDRQDLLSLHIVACAFQLFLPKAHGSAPAAVACLDAIEGLMGSREAFESAFGVLLVDRGVEFDDWAGMERSCLEPGLARCRVFYCDPQDSNGKSQAERLCALQHKRSYVLSAVMCRACRFRRLAGGGPRDPAHNVLAFSIQFFSSERRMP